MIAARSLVVLALAGLFALPASAQETIRIAFDPAAASEGARLADASSYDSARGFGFEPGTPVSVQVGGVHADRPFAFSIKAGPGDYRVSVTFEREGGGERAWVKAEDRRLMLDQILSSQGETSRSFTVNVRNASLQPPPTNAPGGDAVRLPPQDAASRSWDDRLTLEFGADGPRLAAIEIAPVQATRIFLLGDSTVADQPREDFASWGQMLPFFFDDGVSVANHARSGETLKSFLTALRLDKVLEEMRPGDWALIQFGHNDSKANWPQTYADPATTYRDYLRVYVEEVRRRGGCPVLVTSPQRRTFEADGRVRNSHGAYPDAVRAVAQEMGVPLIDLHLATTTLYQSLGVERSRLAFAKDGQDGTHHNNYGAYFLAAAVAADLKSVAPELAAHLRPDAPLVDLAAPPSPAQLDLPASAVQARPADAPAGS